MKCEVLAIEYQFPKLRTKKVKQDLKNFLTIIMKIKLKICENGMIEEMDDADRVFEVKYFPVNDMPSFLVWHLIYEKRVREYMNSQLYGEVRFQNEYYSIREKTPAEDSYPTSLFHCIKARPTLAGISTRRRENDSEGQSVFSPWEVDFMNIVFKNKKADEMFPSAENEEEFIIPVEVQQRFTQFMKTHAKYCGPFIKEVDKAKYPDYTELVKVEIYLTKIYNRIINGYYRSIAALVHDIEMMHGNALAYNDNRSTIVLNARLMCDYLTELV